MNVMRWFVLVLSVFPAMLGLRGATKEGSQYVLTSTGWVFFGLVFVMVGAWSLMTWRVWDQLSDGERGMWRPPYAGTPAILGFGFVGAGIAVALAHLSS